MGDITHAIQRPQWQGDALSFDRRVATAGSGKQLTQDLVDLLVTCDEPTVNGRQEITCTDNGLTGGIGMDDASGRIDKEHPRVEAVQRVGERG
jgi:predicted sulfurtransferase